MHNRISIHGMCLMGSDFQQLPELWQQLQAKRVCLLGQQIEQEGISAARQALDSGNWQLENIVDPFFMGKPLSPEESSWSAPREKINTLIDAAGELQANSIYMTTGGHANGLLWEESAQIFSNAISPCAERARATGISLMLENAPFHNADIHIAHSLRDAITLAEMANLDICIDLFGCWYEADLKNLINRAMPRCQLVQISDYVFGDRAPAARAVPGDGGIPLERLLDQVLTAGYQGAFDLELFGPRIEQEGRLQAVQRAADRLGEILHRLGA